MKDRTVNFQIIGASLAYILVMIISWIKNLDTSGPDAIFSTMILFGMIYRTFIKKEKQSKSEYFLRILMILGFSIIMIASFHDLLY
ncbi:ion transporter [Anaerococcus ihuae]|uniref:ion transporter n=1 Tax=Anaerococcus ihuae TaxID=2899519 RepID=UPI001F39B6C6|nr:ion transporter [Anaerococcus ihuae]